MKSSDNRYRSSVDPGRATKISVVQERLQLGTGKKALSLMIDVAYNVLIGEDQLPPCE